MLRSNYYPYRHLGLLIIRLGLGVAFMIHGWPKITGGPEMWAKIGEVMGTVGLRFGYTGWGLLASLAEFGGGLLLVLGMAHRLACASLAFTMVMAVVMHVAGGDGFNDYSHALESMFAFAGLLLTGPGKYSLDERLFGGRREL